MIGLGTMINSAAIAVGATLGLLLGNRLPENIHSKLIKVIGLFTFGIGLKMFFESQMIALVLLSLAIGCAIGEFIDIEARLDKLGGRFKGLIGSGSGTFMEGLVSTSLIYCVGSMAILGPIREATTGQHDILLAKALLDGICSIGFAASLGIGVLFSFFPVLVYQGVITLLALYLGHFMSIGLISELSATGGLLLSAIGFNLLVGEKKISVANLLPSLVVVVVLVWIAQSL
jgi:uncharacterized membrane protein YqgA involved in biofilm formation